MDELQTRSIHGLEIFAVGQWNGDVYTEKDLDAMVNAFSKVGFEPPVKAGHQDLQERRAVAQRAFGAPSLGWVKKVWREGTTLFADVSNIPARFYNLVKSGAYKRISAEIFWNYKSASGVVYPRVLKAISFLGSDIPAIPTLAAIENLYTANGNQFRLVTYSLKQNWRTYNMENNFGELLKRYNAGDQQAGREVDAAVKENMTDGESYSDCLRRLSREDKARAYSHDGQEPQIGRPKENIAKRYQSGVELDARARELVLSRGYSYTDALKAACRERPDIAQEYTGARHDFASSPMVMLNNLCGGARNDDGSVDWSMALQIAAEDPELCQRAAEARVQELTDRLLALEGTPGSVVNDGGRAEAKRRIRGDYPSLARTSLDGSQVDELALRQILWPKSK